MMNNFINYNNSLDVLNEGFFDFVWNLAKRLFHSMFKAENFEDLYKRLSKLENIIKNGRQKTNESSFISNLNTTSINENRRRRRNSKGVVNYSISKDDETTVSDNDTSINSDSSVDSSNNTEIDSSEIDIDIDKNINLDNIDMNVPSFPMVAKQLLDGLKHQYDNANKQISIDKIKKDIESVKNGQRISQRYIFALEVFTTDFLRKYSKGGISLPKPNGEKPLSYNEIINWKRIAQSINTNQEVTFKSVAEAMEKILTNYRQAFEEQFNELKSKENKFIDKYKDGNKSGDDIKFISEWENKIKSKLDIIMTSCKDSIPVAINTYFISSDIYKTALEYATAALELLVANNKNIISNNDNNDSDNIIYNLQEQFEEDPDTLVAEVNNFISELSDEQKENYFDDNDGGLIDKAFIENILTNETLLKNINKNNLNLKQLDITSKKIYKNSKDQLVFRILIYIATDNLDLLKKEITKK